MAKKLSDDMLYSIMVGIVALVGLFAILYSGGDNSYVKGDITGNAFAYTHSGVAKHNNIKNNNPGHYIYGYFDVHYNETNNTKECGYVGDNYDPFEYGEVKYTYEGNCTDSDGGIKPYIYGYVKDSQGSFVNDTCYDNKSLIEAYCATNGSYMTEYLNCAFGCYNGRCLNESNNQTVSNSSLSNSSSCSDSDDGINVYIKGYTIDANGIHEDNCVGDSYLSEYYCNSTAASEREVIRCNYKCQDGKCVDNEGWSQDYCIGNTLKEYSCISSKHVRVTTGDCSLGCETDSNGVGRCIDRKWIAGYSTTVPPFKYGSHITD